MNELQTQFRNENQITKRLFQRLFLIQVQLENTEDLPSVTNEKSEIIQLIDELMEKLISNYVVAKD